MATMSVTKFDQTNLRVLAGDTKRISLTVTNNGAAVNLSTYALSLIVTDKLNAETALIENTIANSVDGNNHAIGVVVATLTAAQTATLVEPLYYQIVATKTVSLVEEVITLLRGNILVSQAILAGD